MTDAAGRQRKIIELVGEKVITSQEQLQAELTQLGYTVTQATVSRDIKKLRLVKKLDAMGVYRYELSEHEEKTQILSLFRQAVKDIDFAGHTLVIKCQTGMANAVCVAIDTDFDEKGDIVGTIAGDDTIFILLRTPELAEQYARVFEELLS